MLTGLKSLAVLILGTGALSLFAAPAFGQAPPPEKKSPEPKVIAVERLYDLLLDAGEEADPRSPQVDKLRAELKSLEAELQKKMAETQQLKLKIELLRTQEKTAEQAKGDKSAPHVVLRLEDGKGASEEIILRKVDGVWKVVPSDGKGGFKFELRDFPKAGIAVTPPAPPIPGAPAYQPVPPTPMRPGAGAPPHSDADKRIDNLERKLDRMMEILDQLRKEIDGPRKKAGAEDELRRAKELDKAAADAIREKAKAALEEAGRGAELKRALDEAQYRLKEAEAQARAAEKEAEKKAKEAEKRAKEIEKKTSPKPEPPRQ
jgi:hypothetical protein